MEIALDIQQTNPIAFRAEWPDKLNPALDSCIMKAAKIFWEVISYIIFPIILLRYLGEYLKDLILSMLIPGSVHIPKEYLECVGKEMIAEFHGEKLKLSAPDGALLDAVFFEGDTYPRKAIIFACGNGGQWESQYEKLWVLQTFGVSILMIDPRGVGESKGTRFCEGYALDTYTGYEFLHREKKMDLEDILLIGHSMGAGYGSCGAALIQEKYPNKKISMIHDRSFSYLSTEVEAVANRICCCLGTIASSLLYLFDIEFNSKEAFEKLKGQKCVIYSVTDHVIPYKKASLHHHLTEQSLSGLVQIKMDWSGDDHMRPYKNLELTTFTKTVMDFLKLPE